MGETLVSWQAGSVPADSFRVYGIDQGLVLLHEVVTSNATHAFLAPGGYREYAVSGVKDGVESEPIMALGFEEDCVVIAPPAVYVRCIPFVGKPVRVVEFRYP